MAASGPIVDRLTQAGIEFELVAPLAKRTWWRSGGPADVLATARSPSDLVAIQQIASDLGESIFVLGNGSNLLIADAGIRGIVLSLAGELADAVPDDQQPPILTVGAGLKLTILLARAMKYGWTGLECFAGIPGTIGGAIRMNAGASLGETVETLVDVEVVHPDGRVETLAVAELEMGYRHCSLPEGAIILGARVRTTGADPELSKKAIRGHLDYRKRTQPLDMPSCGSTFRNPEGDYAGRLIEASGLKGRRVGAASISEKHANFIVNHGGATSADIRSLIELVQATVEQQHGVELRREVHFVGAWNVDE